MDADLSLHYRYCVERQIALVLSDDGSFEPLLRHTQPGLTPVTSGFPDGQQDNPPPEEMADPDFQTD